MAYPVLTDDALMPASQRDNCYISAEGNAGTHTVCPEALKAATLHWTTILLASNQVIGILIALKVLQNGNRTEKNDSKIPTKRENKFWKTFEKMEGFSFVTPITGLNRPNT
jgi:hypothetical protein